ncbi:MAG: LTA synthase family protein [Gammaproteobacteria bacterium]|nr:LTA synthase family protein [Gammaproteobacteria bacterium]
MDLIIISLFSLLSLILFTFNLHKTNRIYLSIIFTLFILLEFINLHFFEEFDARLNYLFIENLVFLRQILPMFIREYSASIISALIITPLLFYLSFKMSALFFKTESSIKHKIMLLPFLIVSLLISSRGSLGHAAPSPSYYSWSNNHIINEISNNTIFSLLSSIVFHREDKLYLYGTQPETIKKQFRQTIRSPLKNKKRIVLTIMESFGHSFVGSLGGKNTSPEFDKLSKRGLFFSNMYCSSNRTNRGIEAIVSSIYPFVGRTYLKLPDAQHGFWTVAKSLKQKGYRTVFLYGGDINFDNMRSFLLPNGYDEVIDASNIGIDTKPFSWGYADEDVFNKALDILKHYEQPVFLTILTLSNHKPFDFPQGRITPLAGVAEKSFENSIKYADWALGKFTKDLIAEQLYTDSLLVFVADHNPVVRGNRLVPLEHYRIPALFLADDIEHKEITTVTHQADISPTLLAAAGIEATIPAQGFNMLNKEFSRALIIKENSYAFMKDQGYVIYQPGLQPAGNSALFREGLDLIYNSYYAYKNKTHE